MCLPKNAGLSIKSQHRNAKTDYPKRNSLRDATVIELLFATMLQWQSILISKYPRKDFNVLSYIFLAKYMFLFSLAILQKN